MHINWIQPIQLKTIQNYYNTDNNVKKNEIYGHYIPYNTEDKKKYYPHVHVLITISMYFLLIMAININELITSILINLIYKIHKDANRLLSKLKAFR